MSPRLRLVAIGAGSQIFGAPHARAIEELGLEVAAVHDVDPVRVRAVAEPRGWPVAADLDALLASPADLAVVVSPHPFHAEHVIRALEAGRHVLVEKPLAARPSEARAMVAAAEKAGRVLAVALQHRHRPEVRHARDLVARGALGRIERAVVVATYPKRADYYRAAPWRGTWAGEGGGVLLNQGQHDLDALVHLVGMPARVSGWARRRHLPIETEDTVEAMLEWPDGALGSVFVSSAASDPPTRIELVGSLAWLRITPGRLEYARHPQDYRDFADAAGGPFDPFPRGDVIVEEGRVATHTDVYRDLLEAIAEGRPPVASGADALPALDLTAAIIQSSRERRELDLPLDPAAYDALLDDAIRGRAAAVG